MVQKLLSCEYLIGGGCKEVEELQFLWGHIHRAPFIEHGIVGQIHNQIGVFHKFSLLFAGNRKR